MSGISGILHRDDRPVDRAEIAEMLVAAPYRGPDGMSVYVDGAVGLGHAKMAVTPEDKDEWQPLVSPRTGCVVVADVRLDNRAELYARLPERFDPTLGDAEFILRAYEAWNLAACENLLGDFAFVLWDPRKQRLICARDTSGQRQLFYRVDSHTFAAASEIHQLLQDPAVPIEPNEEHIIQQLVPINIYRNEKDSANTYYKGIFAVPAGHLLIVDPGQVHLRRYWKLEPQAELRYRDDDEYAEHFLDLFSAVVADRLRSNGPIGALLSGGLDSSSIVCTAQQLYRSGRVENHGFTSISSVFGDLECDEEEYIREVQAQYGFDARYVPSRDAGGWLRLDKPGFVQSPNMGSLETRDGICEMATRAGARVLLSGDVADSCVGGSRLIFNALIRQGKFLSFWHQMELYRQLSGESLLRTAVFNCVAPAMPLPIQRQIQLADIRRAYRRERHRWVPPWISDRIRGELAQRHVRIASEIERGRQFSDPTRHLESTSLYPPEISRHPSPWPIEYVRPFADRRLHEFLLAIPPEQKFQPHPETDSFYAGSKQIVRRAMKGIVPDRIRTRTSKTFFSSQFQHELTSRWAAFESTFGSSEVPEVVSRGYVDKDHFWSRLRHLRDGELGSDLNYVVHIVGLENWLRAYDQDRPESVRVHPRDHDKSVHTMHSSEMTRIPGSLTDVR